MSGYSFKTEDESGIRRSGWLTPDRIFTTAQFQRRYDSVKISLLTPKCALVPEQFFNPTEVRKALADTVSLHDDDHADYIRMSDNGAVLLYSNSIGETMSKVIAQTVLTTDGYQARILPELYFMLESLKDCTEYNKIVAAYADSHLHLVMATGKTLQVANTFSAADFTTAEYFIFSMMKRLQLNPEVSTISFRTPLSEEQTLSLYRYFKSVEQI